MSQAKENRWVVRKVLKMDKDGAFLRWRGTSFHNIGAATAKERHPLSSFRDPQVQLEQKKSNRSPPWTITNDVVLCSQIRAQVEESLERVRDAQ